MNLAINFSKTAAKLYCEKKINLNYFKITEHEICLNEAQKILPTYIHFDLMLGGKKPIDSLDIKRIQKFLKISDRKGVFL